MDENKIKFEFIKKKKSTRWRVKVWKDEKKRPWQKRGGLLEPPRGQVGTSCSFSLRLPMKTVSYRFEGFGWKYVCKLNGNEMPEMGTGICSMTINPNGTGMFRAGWRVFGPLGILIIF